MVLSLIGFIGAIVILIRKLVLPSVAVGWSSLMVAICFFSGMIMFFLGLLGEYIGRLFQDSTNSPQFVVRTVYTQESKASAAPLIAKPEEAEDKGSEAEQSTEKKKTKK
jgi:undecaprenyl-phosphate 4-deoxy-4-formamido-L-arabinose transferase